MRIVKKQIPIFFGFLRIIIANDFVKATQEISYQPPFDVSKFDAFVYSDYTKKGYGRFTVFFNPKATESVIAHEVVHLVNAVFIHTHMNLDPHYDEPQAYLTGWMTRQIYKALKHK